MSSFEKFIALGGAGEVVRKDGENWRWKVRQEIGSTRVAEEASSELIEHDTNREGWGTSGTSGVSVLQGKTEDDFE
jgi:hypothetical protein